MTAPAPGQSGLQVRGLRRHGLQPLSFDLGPGEAMAVTGPSGAGKSLLLRALADLDPNQGQVSLDGVSRSQIPAPPGGLPAGGTRLVGGIRRRAFS